MLTKEEKIYYLNKLIALSQAQNNIDKVNFYTSVLNDLLSIDSN